MILSKASLEAHRLGKQDKLPIRLGEDGSVVGTSRKSWLIASPVAKEIRIKHPLFDDRPLPAAAAISVESAAEVYRDIKRDTKFRGLLEHTDVEYRGEGIEDGLRFRLSDGRRPRSLDVQAAGAGEEPEPVLRRAYDALSGARGGVTACLNIRRLLQLLEAIDRAIGDSTGESPIWAAVTPGGDIALRAVSRATGQRFIGYMRAYAGVEGEAPGLSAWEQRWGRKPKRLPPPKRK